MKYCLNLRLIVGLFFDKINALRAGEKLYEELLIWDNVSKTENPLIMRAKEDKYDWDKLKLMLDKLVLANDGYDHKNVREILIEIVPGYKPESGVNDILYKNKD